MIQGFLIPSSSFLIQYRRFTDHYPCHLSPGLALGAHQSPLAKIKLKREEVKSVEKFSLSTGFSCHFLFNFYNPAVSIQYSKRKISTAAGMTTTQSLTLKSCGKVRSPKSPLRRIFCSSRW